jgi:hypothetical protein
MNSSACKQGFPLKTHCSKKRQGYSVDLDSPSKKVKNLVDPVKSG